MGTDTRANTVNKVLDLAEKKSESKNAADYFREHSFTVFLWPEAWRSVTTDVDLEWGRVEFGKETIGDVPEVRGLYALSVSIKETIMPPHGVIVYFGETSRTLRARYREYIRDSLRGGKRRKFGYLFDLWSSDLYFFFAPLADEDIDLKEIELSLNDAVIPLCVTDDFSAEIRQMVAILRG